MKPFNYQGTSYFLSNPEESRQRFLCVSGDTTGFQGKLQDDLFICPLNSENAAALRKRLPWLKPRHLGEATSFGFGDRLGLATPGHIAAVKNTGIAPIFAQQSVRENERTGRDPQTVLDDAMWAVFETGWQDPWGADADHIKEIADLDPFISAGYSFYTIDPNLYVDDQAHTDPIEVLTKKIDQIPWIRLDSDLLDQKSRYLDSPISCEGLILEFSQEDLFKALGKYGRALAHIKGLSDHLMENLDNFDLEVSVDETDTPTSVKEHYFIALELRRLGVPFISLAPRFVGSFEKGVDYIGDLPVFEREFADHAKVMRTVGGYKLSIHTGSDKFSIYPLIARKTKRLVHVKTAGTSYLEALRVVAEAHKDLFREILEFSRSRYDVDRATYHVSGDVDRVPVSSEYPDDQLTDLLDQFDTRQVLHVTFGSVLDIFGSRIKAVLSANPEVYRGFLEEHFTRHLEHFKR